MSLNEKQLAYPHEDTSSLNEFYGNPRGKDGKVSTKWFRDNIMKWEPPYPFFYSDGRQPLKTLFIHKLCLDTFNNAFQEVLDHFGPEDIDNKRLNICAGTYNYRLMRGGSKLSVHAYGISIDIDPEHNPYPHPWTENGLDKDFITILEKHGFYWRGTNGDVDPMHFQCAYRGKKVTTQTDRAFHKDHFEAPKAPSPEVVIPNGESEPETADVPNGEFEPETADVPTTIYRTFVNAGFTPEQASGVVANVEAESGFDIHNIGDGGRARGIFQMHPDRRTTIKEATDIDMARASIIDQCKGAIWELQHIELVALREIKKAENPFQAGYAMCRYYERPKSHYEWIKRGKKAQHWYEQFTK